MRLPHGCIKSLQETSSRERVTLSEVFLKVQKPIRTLTLHWIDNAVMQLNIDQVAEQDVGPIDDRSFPWLRKGQEAKVNGGEDAGQSNLPQPHG